MNPQYDVTIGIPVYNAEQFLRQTMDSALAQTYQSIEFLLVDDGGSDGSVALLRELQATHPRGADLRIVSQPRNMGVSAARNRIIDEARGRFLYFMDSDDTIEPHTIALLMEHQRRTEADVVFGSYEKIEVYNGGARADACIYPRCDFLGDDQLASFAYRKYGGIQASACNYLVSLDLLRSTGLRFIDTNYWEDMAFTFDLVTYARRAVLLPDVTYHYLCRLDSLSNYQQRTVISKAEVERNMATVAHMKRPWQRLQDKPYLPNRYYNAVMTDFYVVCNILKNRHVIQPAFTARELKAAMRHPASLSAILGFRQARTKNLLLWMLGRLPAQVMVLAVKCLMAASEWRRNRKR